MKYLFLLILPLLISCGGVRKITRNETVVTKDSTAYYRTENEKLTVERDEYARKVQELEYMELTFVACPDLDSLRSTLKRSGCDTVVIERLIPAPSTIKKNADGSLEVTGQIKSLAQSKSRLEDELRVRDKAINELNDSLMYYREQNTAKANQFKETKRPFPWLWLVLSFVGGFGLATALLMWAFKNTD